MNLIIRDHDRAKFESRKEFLRNLTDYLNGVYGAGTFELVLKDSYYNMREKIEPHMHLIDRALAAFGIGRGAQNRAHPGRNRRHG